jgi:hypothetical protein
MMVMGFVVAHKVATIGSWPSFLGNKGSKSSLVIVASLLSQWQNFGDLFFIIVVTYEIRVFFEGAQKEVFSSI